MVRIVLIFTILVLAPKGLLSDEVQSTKNSCGLPADRAMYSNGQTSCTDTTVLLQAKVSVVKDTLAITQEAWPQEEQLEGKSDEGGGEDEHVKKGGEQGAEEGQKDSDDPAEIVALKTIHGKYVVAEKNGQMNANRDSWCSRVKFKMIKHRDGTISLKSIHGKYVVAERNGRMKANRPWMRSWEKFKLIKHKDHTISLKSAHGKYVVAERNGRLNAMCSNKRWMRSLEKFKLIHIVCPLC